MSKYIDSRESVDIDKVEEAFKKGYAEAERKAREEANRVLAKIKRYKKTSFDELAKEVEQEFKDVLEFHLEGAKEDPSRMDWDIEHYIASTLDIKDRSKKHEEAKRRVKNMSPEEKFEIYSKIERKKINENCENKKHSVRELDILYDSMTEEQIEEYINLIYIMSLKEELIEVKTNAMMENTERADIVFGKKDPEDGIRENGHLYEVEESARKIVAVEEMSAKDVIDKEEIIDKAKTALGALFGSSLLGTGAASVASFIAQLAGNTDLSYNLFMSTPIFIAATLALCGVPTIKEFIKNKRAIAEAKKFGLYDLIMDKYKAENDFENYEEHLKEEHGLKLV